ncbi:MAG: hypothetical protein JWR26_3154 [Pedosphaera sp.]|nr:hypothetical protein [Pedosphaera sp.]
MGYFDRLFNRKQVFSMQPSDLKMWQASRASRISPACECFKVQDGKIILRELSFHSEAQDTSCEAWKVLNDLIEVAASKGSTEFAPGLEMPPESWSQIITLPASISKLKSVRKLYLYGSHLERVPREIGEMESLEELDLYTSYRLHWMPFEVTRCLKLKRSRVSTRALYGNYKYRPSFPRLGGLASNASASPGSCSVCGKDSSPDLLTQLWISLRVATDVLPLLVNACSDECIRRLPRLAPGYVGRPHAGGLDVVQPPTVFGPPRP